jgi:hypothetical protein
MLGDSFFIYKLDKSNYWCDSYSPSKLIHCQSPCDEIRFDLNDIYSPNGSRPEELDGASNEWKPLLKSKISCEDEIDDVIVLNSTDINDKNVKILQGNS